eukprot:3122767-Amphidinium_carterae.1
MEGYNSCCSPYEAIHTAPTLAADPIAISHKDLLPPLSQAVAPSTSRNVSLVRTRAGLVSKLLLAA